MEVNDQFYKMAPFIPFHKSDDTSHIAYLYFKKVIMLRGMPRSIVYNCYTPILFFKVLMETFKNQALV